MKKNVIKQRCSLSQHVTNNCVNNN